VTTDPKRSVEYYVDRRGKAPAAEFLEGLPPKDRAALLRTIRLLKEFGRNLREPHAKPVKWGKKKGLWELRGRAGRLFYFAYKDGRFIILHGYRKKTKKTPSREIRTAWGRWDEFLAQEDEWRAESKEWRKEKQDGRKNHSV